MFLTFTADDQFILEQYRLERLQSCFADTLPLCWLHLGSNQRLTIHCAEPWMVDQLMGQIAHLREQVRVILGVRQVSIFFAQEEIYKTGITRSANKRKLSSQI